MTLSLCVAGLGKYAEHVLSDARSSLEGIDLFFASRDVEKARDFNHRYGGMGVFASYEEAASDPRVDAIYFITPHHLHLENALLAAGNSKHILMEKPIARTVAEAEQIIAAARNAGVTLMIAENHRFLPTVALTKRMVEDGAVGRVRYVQAHAESYGARRWRADPELAGGGMLIDGGDVTISSTWAASPPASTRPSPPPPRPAPARRTALTAQLPGGVVGAQLRHRDARKPQLPQGVRNRRHRPHTLRPVRQRGDARHARRAAHAGARTRLIDGGLPGPGKTGTSPWYVSQDGTTRPTMICANCRLKRFHSQRTSVPVAIDRRLNTWIW